MEIQNKSHLNGARKAKGLCVIIDVFRACSVLCYAAYQKPTDLIISTNLNQIKKLKETHLDSIFIGKNHQITDDLFNISNSPYQINKCDLFKKTIVQHSAGGISGLVEANMADEVITGSLVNANAIARYIKTKNPQQVTLVSMGYLGYQTAIEDDLCAEYIKCLIQDIPFDYDNMLNSLEMIAKPFFLRGDINVPPEDFYLCTDLNRFDFVLQRNVVGDIIKLLRIDI
jgi:2-phosphosulfolactate phosphatase